MKIRKSYLTITILLLITEIIIALYVHDRFIRPYAGDFLVVILMYCFFRSFFNFSISQVAIGVLLFAYLIEFSQYLDLVKRLGLGHLQIVKIILGNAFEWIDMIAYTLGIGLVVMIEKIRLKPGLKNFL